MENLTKQKILIADDSAMNRLILADMLEDQFEILEAEDGTEALAMLQKFGVELTLVLLDIVMPNMDGFEVLAFMNTYGWINDIPVIMISAENSLSYMERAYDLGVTDYINRPFDALVVRRRVLNTIMLYAKQKRLIGLVTDQIYEKQKSNSLMINILSCIVEFRNGESGLHVLHIGAMTEILLNQLMQNTDRYPLRHADISLITTASALHDIGKIAIPDEILNKPGRLTQEEFKIMQTHTTAGAAMLERLPYFKSEPLVNTALEICRWHHERYDGRGYPDGLRGEEIPISAQVVSLADVYDALTSERVYKKAFSHEKAMDMIFNGECGAFNPLLLKSLVDASDNIQSALKVSSPLDSEKKELRKVAEEMLNHEELSASERTLQLLEHERTKYQFFASITQEILFEYTSDPSMMSVSEWGARLLGIDEVVMGEELHRRLLEVLGPTHYTKIVSALHHTTPKEPMMQYDCQIKINGELRWYHIIARVTWSTENPPRYLGAIGKAVDIHDDRMHLIDLTRMASHDSLTGLLNPEIAKTRIQEKLQNNPDSHFALGLLDVDHFQQANNQRGHVFGDHLLKYAADCLRKNLRNNDVMARVGGDEFLIFIEYQDSLPQIIGRISQALQFEYEQFAFTISMGIATTEMGVHTFDDLFHRADQALYTSKQKGCGGYCFYDDSMKETFSASVISPIETV